MKAFILLILFSANCLNLFSQGTDIYNYDNKTDLWQYNRNSFTDKKSTDKLFQWQFVQTPITSQLTEIFFYDSTYGWATHTNNGAMRTTDGGYNWLTISFADTTFTTSYSGVFFINLQTGWCCGGSVQIRKTTNGGANWFKQYAPPVAGVLNGICFFDANTGIAIGRKTASYNSFIAKTTNGGANWYEITAATANENELSDQYWFNSNTGWICGKSILLKTINGGLNWTNYYSSVPPTQNGINALLSIYFVNQQTGWIGGSNIDHQNIYKTTNGGLNWVFQNNPVTGYAYSQINDVKFLSSDSGWAIHGTPVSGAIMFTTNGGNNWIIEEGSNNWFDCISVYQRYKVWCGSSGGKVWYSYMNNIVGIKKINTGTPSEIALYQNYPNPFNPATKIKFELPKQESVTVKIFDALGREVTILVNEQLAPGIYETEWNAANYPSGIYFYILKAGDFTDTKRMTLIK